MIESCAADCETIRATVGERGDHVATVILDRPDARNALNAQLRGELTEVLGAIAESSVRVVVLTGSPESEAFVAGADVRELRDRGPLEQRHASRRPRVYERVAELPQPVIARVNGWALGGGCELALATDLRVAHERATLGQPEIGLGLIPGGGATQRLPRLVGEGQAMRLILTGELLDAEEALEIGLVDEVCDEGTLDERVNELARGMARHSPVALELGKEAVRAAGRMDLPDGIDYEAELFSALFAHEDVPEGIDAHLEGREPNWTDRPW
jgi:enoyl-CoA hydratase